MLKLKYKILNISLNIKISSLQADLASLGGAEDTGSRQLLLLLLLLTLLLAAGVALVRLFVLARGAVGRRLNKKKKTFWAKVLKRTDWAF